MSKRRAIDAINLKKVDKIPFSENMYHYDYIEEVTGIDPFKKPVAAYRDFYKFFDMDLIIEIPDSKTKTIKFSDDESVKESNGTKFTKWGIEGSKWDLKHGRFKNISDLLDYDPLKDKASKILSKEHTLESLNRRIENQEIMGSDALVTGVYYTTLFMFPLLLFGWELFLIYAMEQKKDFLEKIKAFTEISLRNIQMWLDSGSEVFLCHDDIALTRGLVFPKEWYSEYIFPYYREIWKPVKDKGIPLLFVSDGKYSELIDDLVEIGVDGLFVDHNNDLNSIILKYGGKIAIIGNIDTRVLTFGKVDDVSEEITNVLSKSKGCPGYFLKASGDLPHNIPIANIRQYFEEINRIR